MRVRVEDLKPGMVLAENLVLEGGNVLFPAGKVLEEEDIAKIRQFPRLEFATVEGENVLIDILKEKEKTAPEELKQEVERALRFCCPSDGDLKEQARLLAIRYRLLIRGSGK